MLITSPTSPFAVFLFAHGAGAPMDSDFMTAIAERLAARGLAVARFEFPYMAARRSAGRKRPPDRMPVLLESFAAAARAARAEYPELPLLIGGKSMGARAAAMAAEAIAPVGVIGFGYPFHAAGKAATPERLAPLAAPPCPVLLAQGTRDALGSAEEVATYPLAAEVCWIADGDHALKPRRASGHTLEASLDLAADAAAAFARRTCR